MDSNSNKIVRHWILLIIGLILVTYTVLFLTESKRDPSNLIIDFSLGVSLLCGTIFFYYQQHSIFKGYWIKPSNLVILGLWAVNFQKIANYRFGYVSSKAHELISAGYLNQSALISVVSLVSFMCGYICLTEANTKCGANYASPKRLPITFFSIVQVIVFVLWLSQVNLSDFVTARAYRSITSAGLDTYFEYLFQIVVIALFVQVILNGMGKNSPGSFRNFVSSVPVVSWVIMVLYMLLKLVSGDRGPTMYTALAIFFAYVAIYKVKISFAKVLLIVLGGAILMSVIGIARSMNHKLSISDKIANSLESYNSSGRFGSKSVFNPTEELAFSFVCNQSAIALIDRGHSNYHYGTYQLCYIANTIPFMPSILKGGLHIANKDLSSSLAVTEFYVGKHNRKWSIGTTLVADFYLEGGIWGILIGMFAVGALFKFVDKTILFGCNKRHRVVFIAISLLLASKAIYIARTAILMEFKSLIMVLLLYGLFRIWINLTSRGEFRKHISQEDEY